MAWSDTYPHPPPPRETVKKGAQDYLIKGKIDSELLTCSIVYALERKRLEQELRPQRTWFEVTLSRISDAVIATDTESHINFMNSVAESLTGWDHQEAIGRPVEEVFNIVNEQTHEPVENPVARVLQEGMITELTNHSVLIAKNGQEIPINDNS